MHTLIILLRTASSCGVNIFSNFYTYESNKFRYPYFLCFMKEEEEEEEEGKEEEEEEEDEGKKEEIFD